MIHVIVFTNNKVYCTGFSMHRSATNEEVAAAVSDFAQKEGLADGYFFEVS